MSTTRTFSPAVFDSYANLQNFFMSSDAVNQVLDRKDKPFSKVLSPLNPNLACKWLVCQIATAPLRWTLAIVLKVIAKIASGLGAREFAKQAKTTSQYLWAGFNIYSETPTKLYRIKSAVNRPNAEGRIISNTPPILRGQITDPRVWKRSLCRLGEDIKFNNNGICRGMSNWFLYLYLKTKDQFSDPRSHMAALGRQFVNGGGVDPTVLQTVLLLKGKLFNLKIGAQADHSGDPAWISLLRVPVAQWNPQAEQIRTDLQILPPGGYSIFMPGHIAAYVKINDTLSYFFEPSNGVTEISGNAVGEKVYDLISKSWRLAGGGNEEFPFITVTPVSLRT